MPAKPSKVTKINTSKTPFPTRVDVPSDTRIALGMILNERLADFLDLERQAKQAHWNVKGPRFMPLHELFDATAALAVGSAHTHRRRSGQAVVVCGVAP